MTKSEWLKTPGDHSARDKDLLSRAYDTLMGNVYEDTGYPWSPYRCTCPGKVSFRGIWNWDSAFHVMGLSRWDTALAKENVLGFFQYQREDGLLPDCIFEDGTLINGFSKPPVFPYAIETLYKRDGDKEFLGDMYRRLVHNEAYMMQNRYDRGLFFYDADDKDSEDYLLHVKYESGWDNSVRWDNGITEYYAVDLNCFMVMSYRSLAFMAGELGYDADRAAWLEKEAALAKRINEALWDKENRYYSDAHRFTGKVSPVLSPASFMPLYVKIASEEQADAMRIVAETRFEGKMPTVSFDNPAYSNDYWRGPTWLNVAYFAAKGLKNYGFAIADTIKENILSMCDAEKRGIHENYDSRTGKGLCCDHFSWSSVFVIEFILNF